MQTRMQHLFTGLYFYSVCKIRETSFLTTCIRKEFIWLSLSLRRMRSIFARGPTDACVSWRVSGVVAAAVGGLPSTARCDGWLSRKISPRQSSPVFNRETSRRVTVPVSLYY